MKGNHLKRELHIIAEQFWPIFFVQMMSHITLSVGNTINGLVIGNALSPIALAALGLVNPITFVVSATSNMISSGAQIVSGHYMGRGEKEKVDIVFSTAIIGTIAISLMLSAIIIVGATPVASLIGATDETMHYTVDYLRGYATCFIPIILTPTLSAFLMLANQSAKVVIGSIIQAASNLVFIILAVNLYPDNMFAAGVATGLSVLVAMIYMVVCFSMDKGLMHCRIGLFRFSVLGKTCIAGTMMALSLILAGVRNLLINKQLVVYGGTPAVTAMSIMFSIILIQDGVLLGGSKAISIMSAVAVSEKDSKQTERIFGYEIKMGIIMMAAAAAVMTALGQVIARAFGADAEVARLTQIFIAEYHFGEVLWMVFLGLTSAHIALGYSTFASVLTIIGSGVCPIIFIFMLPPLLGVVGVGGSLTCQCILGVIVLYVAVWIMNKKCPRTLADLLMLKDYGIKHSMNISVSTKEEVCTVSASLSEFLKSNGIDNKRAQMSGLCLEEMAANIIEHGGAGLKARKAEKMMIDIYAAIDGENVILRIRDNAQSFDPVARLSMYDVDNEDQFARIGIRMVSKIAKDMNYQNTFGKNVLLISL